MASELDDYESAQLAHFVSQVRGTGHWRDDEPLGDTEPAYTIESAHRTILLAGPQLYDYALPAEYPHCARSVKVVTPGVLERVQAAVWGAAALAGDVKVMRPGQKKYSVPSGPSGEFEVFPLKHKFSSINFIVLDAEPVPQRLLDGFDLRHCGVAVRIGRTRPGTLHLDFQLSPATAAAIAERRLEPTAHLAVAPRGGAPRSPMWPRGAGAGQQRAAAPLLQAGAARPQVRGAGVCVGAADRAGVG